MHRRRILNDVLRDLSLQQQQQEQKHKHSFSPPPPPAALQLMGLLLLPHHLLRVGLQAEARYDFRVAFSAIRGAAELGSSRALGRLAAYYKFGLGAVEIDYRKAAQSAEAAFRAGFPGEAGYVLATCLLTGAGCEADTYRAAKVLAAAGRAGDPLAHWKGSLLALRRGGGGCGGKTAPSGVAAEPAAFERVEAVGRGGNPLAQYAVCREYRAADSPRHCVATGIAWLRKAADARIAVAETCLGAAYGTGLVGHRHSEASRVAEARRWLERGAEQGDPEALCYMADLLFQEGADPQRVWRYYLRAAQRGIVPAMYNVGCRFADGIGCTPDPVQATRYFRMAAERDDLAAMYNLAQQYRAGEGTPKDEKEALRWFLRAARLGEVSSMRSVASAYQRGDAGLVPDPAEAAVWRARATHVEAACGLAPTRARTPAMSAVCPLHDAAYEAAHRKAVAHLRLAGGAAAADTRVQQLFRELATREEAALERHSCHYSGEGAVSAANTDLVMRMKVPHTKAAAKLCASCGKTGDALLKCCGDVARYCDRTCQRQAWPQHKAVCLRRRG